MPPCDPDFLAALHLEFGVPHAPPQSRRVVLPSERYYGVKSTIEGREDIEKVPTGGIWLADSYTRAADYAATIVTNEIADAARVVAVDVIIHH